MQEIQCDTWLDFLSQLEKRKQKKAMLYRGHRQAEWRTQSTLLREVRKKIKADSTERTQKEEDNVLSRRGTEYGGRVMQSFMSHFAERQGKELTDRQLFIMGRHQGLLTPFLDWTRSPFIAAFFGAVEVVERLDQRSGGHFAILELSSWLFPLDLSKRAGDGAPLRRHALQINAASVGNPRGIAQRGVATYLFPDTDIETFADEVSTGNCGFEQPLRKYTIPHACAEDVLHGLQQMNINYVTLFPDEFGLAKQANLNLYLNLEGMGNWMVPPGFCTLLPEDGTP